MTNNEIIKLRSKPTGNGNRSLYLDLYYKGDRRYEFLHLYLVPNEQNPTDLKTRTPSNWQMQSNSKEPPSSSMIYTGSPAKKPMSI